MGLAGGGAAQRPRLGTTPSHQVEDCFFTQGSPAVGMDQNRWQESTTIHKAIYCTCRQYSSRTTRRIKVSSGFDNETISTSEHTDHWSFFDPEGARLLRYSSRPLSPTALDSSKPPQPSAVDRAFGDLGCGESPALEAVSGRYCRANFSQSAN